MWVGWGVHSHLMSLNHHVNLLILVSVIIFLFIISPDLYIIRNEIAPFLHVIHITLREVFDRVKNSIHSQLMGTELL